MIHAGQTFPWRGRDLEYLDHPYNTTARNERALEVPIARAWLEGRPSGGVEVGHVLGHYIDHRHLVVDAHEQAPGVINIDAAELRAEFPWVLAVSTLEHVGRDMGERADPGAAERLLEHLVGLVAPGGGMLATVPFDQHPGLDELILAGGTGCARQSTWLYHPNGWVELPDAPVWGPTRDEGAWPSAVWMGEWGT